MTGGTGNDILTGGNSSDTFIFAALDGTDTITDFSGADVIGLSGGLTFGALLWKVAACKSGRKPESAQAKSEVVAWFEWARQQRIVIAMSLEDVYTPDGEAVEIGEMMRRCPMQE